MRLDPDRSLHVATAGGLPVPHLPTLPGFSALQLVRRGETAVTGPGAQQGGAAEPGRPAEAARLTLLGRSLDPSGGLVADTLGSEPGSRMNLDDAVNVLVRQAA